MYMGNGIDAPFRKQMRLKDYDYSKAGYYFVTICALNRREILGQVVGGDAQRLCQNPNPKSLGKKVNR